MKGSILDKVDAYLRCAVSMGEYPSARRLKAHAEAFFEGVELEGKRLLDVGGGAGLLSLYAASRGAHAVCIEPEADGSTRGAARRFGELASCANLGERAELHVSTIQGHKSDHLYDIIIMANTINHLDEEACIRLSSDEVCRDRYVNIFRNIFDLMTPGGLMIITDCDRRNIFNTLGIRSPVVPSIEWYKHQHPMTWLKILVDAGFEKGSYRWLAPARLGYLGKIFLGNRLAAFGLTGMFRMMTFKPR